MAKSRYSLTLEGETKPLGDWIRLHPTLNAQTIRGRASGRAGGDIRFKDLSDTEILFGKRQTSPCIDAGGYFTEVVREAFDEHLDRIARSVSVKVNTVAYSLYGGTKTLEATAAYRIGEDIQFSNGLNLSEYLREFCGGDPRRMLSGEHDVPDKGVIIQSLGLLQENDSDLLTPFEAAQLLMLE